MQTEFQLVELEARFQAKQAELQQAKARAAESDSSLVSNEGVNRQLRERIVEEFKHDPEVAVPDRSDQVNDRRTRAYQGCREERPRSSSCCNRAASGQTQQGIQ